MKKGELLSVWYCMITLIVTYVLGHILLERYFVGKTVGEIVLFILVNLIPMITSCVFSILTRECKHVWDFFKSAFLRKENAVVYFIVIVIPVIYYGVSAILKNISYTNESISTMLAYLPWTLLQGGLEEVGWRWYLQKHIPIKSFILKMLIISVVWFAWHIPIYRLPWITRASSNYLIFYLMILGNTFTLGMLGEKTNGAVPCILAHMLIDTCAVLMLVQGDLICIAVLVVFEILISVQANELIKVKHV